MPLRDSNGELKLQFVAGTGSKKYLRGGLIADVLVNLDINSMVVVVVRAYATVRAST